MDKKNVEWGGGREKERTSNLSSFLMNKFFCANLVFIAFFVVATPLSISYCIMFLLNNNALQGTGDLTTALLLGWSNVGPRESSLLLIDFSCHG